MLFKCEAQSCGATSVRGASCLLCSRRLYRTHLGTDFHTCPDSQVNYNAWLDVNEQARQHEVKLLVSILNLDALRARASSLKGGVGCTIPPLEYDSEKIYDVMGGMNYHIPIDFDDGDAWICRIRRSNASSPPVELRNRVIESEFATLRFLAGTKVPVPRVHDFALESLANPVGVGYILMDRLRGSPLEWYDLDEAKKRHFLDQFADIFVELSIHSFPSIGCLMASGSDDFAPGPLVVDSFADYDEQGSLSLLGPFSTAMQYRKDVIQRHLDLIRNGEAYPKTLVDAYLVHRYLLDSVPLLARHEDNSDGRFFLKHMDDKGDHIFVDEDVNIVGIIDWEWAQTVPKAEAFAAPLFLLDVGEYYDKATNELGSDEKMFADILDEKGYQGIANCVREGCLEHRLAHCIGGDVENVRDFRNLFDGLRAALHRTRQGSLAWDTWRAAAMAKYKGDATLKVVQGIM